MAAHGKEDGYHLTSLRGKLTSVCPQRGWPQDTYLCQSAVSDWGDKVKHQHLHLQVKIIPFLRP